MEQMLLLAVDNLLSPIILCFVLGVAASLARSDLSFPEAAAKAMSLYLLFAIGFKGGVSVASHGIDLTLGMSLIVGIILSALLPLIAFLMLTAMTNLSRTDAAAVAAHYGSISIVTFVAGTSVLQSSGIEYEGFMVAVAAAMEAPAILSALWLISRTGRSETQKMDKDLWREILLNGSIVLLIGSFMIGWATGEDGLTEISPFIVSPFKGVLCLFLLDMGLVAGRGLRGGGGVLQPGVLAFGIRPSDKVISTRLADRGDDGDGGGDMSSAAVSWVVMAAISTGKKLLPDRARPPVAQSAGPSAT